MGTERTHVLACANFQAPRPYSSERNLDMLITDHLVNMVQPCQRRGDTDQLAPLRTVIALENERRFDNCNELSATGLPCHPVHEAPTHSIALVSFDKIIQTIKALQANGVNLIASCTAFASRYAGHAWA